MESYKERAICACKSCSEKGDGAGWLRFDGPICCVYENNGRTTECCRGCPFADQECGPGCVDFSSYRLAMLSGDVNNAGELCREFFAKVIPMLEKIPTKRFSPSGWKYFKELNRGW